MVYVWYGEYDGIVVDGHDVNDQIRLGLARGLRHVVYLHRLMKPHPQPLLPLASKFQSKESSCCEYCTESKNLKRLL